MNWPSDADRIEFPSPGENLESKIRIEYAVRSNGRMDVKDWLRQAEPSVRNGFLLSFEQLWRDGDLRNENHFKRFQGVPGIWEFRKKIFRIFAYKHEDPKIGVRWILVSVYQKGSLDQNKEAKKARVAALDFLARESERGS